MSIFNKIHVLQSLGSFFIGILFGYLIFISLSLFVSMENYHDKLRDPHSSSDLKYSEGPEKVVGSHSMDGAHVYENNSIALQLYKYVRVLCWIMTNPRNHRRKALHVKRTWGSLCNKLLFMSTAEDPKLESIALPVKEGYDYLWAKTKEAFKYIYEHHMDDADWFLKADDDTYVIVENLRYLLQPIRLVHVWYVLNEFELKKMLYVKLPPCVMKT